MMVIPETRRAHYIWYLRWYFKKRYDTTLYRHKTFGY